MSPSIIFIRTQKENRGAYVWKTGSGFVSPEMDLAISVRKCTLRDAAGIGNILNCEITFDQTELAVTQKSSRSIEARSPVIGLPSAQNPTCAATSRRP
jgi:hypothetical protein